jgi:hypothetical protein
MRPWSLEAGQPGLPPGIAGSQLLRQATPFELQLTASDRETAGRPSATDPRGGKTVATAHGLVVDDSQILGDAAHGTRVVPEPAQLRVMGVPLRPPPQYGLGEQAFPPQRNETAGIQVAGMQAPEPQGPT